MKNKLTVLAMLLVVFFGGMFTLVGCADKYDNLKINVYGAQVSIDENTGQKYISITYDENNADANLVSFSAQIEGYADDMLTTMRLSVPQDKVLVQTGSVRGDVTTFNVRILSSGIIPIVIYSNETSKVSARLEIRAFLPTSQIADKGTNLAFARPTEDTASYVLNDESIIDFSPANSTVRGLVYSLDNTTGASITTDNGISTLVLDPTAPTGVLPITVKSTRIVESSADYDANLSDEEIANLTTTIYAFVYDTTWQLYAFNNDKLFDATNNSLILSTQSTQYSFDTSFGTKTVNGDSVEIQELGISDIYFDYSAESTDTNVVTVDKTASTTFNLFAVDEGSAVIKLTAKLYYVPNLTENQVLTDLSKYRQVMQVEYELSVTVSQTATALQITTYTGVVSTYGANINIFAPVTDETTNQTTCSAYIDVQILPLTLDSQNIQLATDKTGITVYYYRSNGTRVDVNFTSTDDDSSYISGDITCGRQSGKLKGITVILRGNSDVAAGAAAGHAGCQAAPGIGIHGHIHDHCQCQSNPAGILPIKQNLVQCGGKPAQQFQQEFFKALGCACHAAGLLRNSAGQIGLGCRASAAVFLVLRHAAHLPSRHHLHHCVSIR